MTTNNPASTIEKASLLFVDDEKNILSSLKRLFRSEGYTIHLANSGAEGLDILTTHKINLVISDMRMPEMNGAEFLEKVATTWPAVTRILLTGYSEVSSTIDAVNKGNIYKYISKPWEDNDIKLTVKHALEAQAIEIERDKLLALTQRQNEELKDFNSKLEDMVKTRTAELDQTMAMLERAYETLKDSYSTTIQVFSNLIELREDNLQSHSKQVAQQAYDLALTVGMTDDTAKQISFAGLLRNIGKIGFADSINRKSVDDMTPTEAIQYKKHPILGSSILMALEPLQTAASLIHGYCEQYDGHGYPDQLAGENIPLGCRILNVVSDFHALQTGTLIPKKLDTEQARDYLLSQRGKRYDPNIVNAFINELIKNEQHDNIQKETLISAHQLKINMKLARDLVTKDGILLLSEGHLLGEHMIKQINKLEKSLDETLQIYIHS